MERANQIHSKTGQNAFTFQMPDLIGEGFNVRLEYVTTTNVQAFFRNDELWTLYPLIQPLKP